MSHSNDTAMRRDHAAGSAAAVVSTRAHEPAAPPFLGVTTGTLVGFDADGVALVDLPTDADARPLRARSCVELTRADSGKEVALVFENGDRRHALIIGTLRGPTPRGALSDNAGTAMEFGRDHLTLTGSESVTLRCGAASITLRADGKITIRGAELESRASGLLRIQGGSVRIN